jgi:hypothetical protein
LLAREGGLSVIDEESQPPLKKLDVPCLTFPDDHDPPTETVKGVSNSTVTCDVRIKLGLPELSSGLRSSSPTATMVTVPETAVYEDHQTTPRKDEIRSSRKASVVQSEAIA